MPKTKASKKELPEDLAGVVGPLVVLVTGGRNYENVDKTVSTLNFLHKKFTISKLIHGAARGADTFASNWATLNKIPQQGYPAKWGTSLGLGAGPARNAQMLESEPTINFVVAFPGERGTSDMVKRAEGKGLKVYMPEGSISLKKQTPEEVFDEPKKVRRAK